ncbi:hypothetical protein AB1Y20_002466 [Prymnesium parvum]|uniref:J domain-containing protein n=1 Tax=Prymnesium parvum TaxID=97485 RepID=A0AB34JB60_PRYPA
MAPPPRRLDADLEVLRTRMRHLREGGRASSADAQLLGELEFNLLEARARAHAAQRSKAELDQFLRRCRLEVSAARTAFEQDVRRHEAVFKSCEEHRARRRAEAGKAEGTRPRRIVLAGTVAPAEQARRFAAWEAAFARFEAAEEGSWRLEEIPWPPKGCSVTGIRAGDSQEVQRLRLKQALLRWHPDKFFGRHGAKLFDGESAEIMARVSAMLQRVQAERLEHRLDASLPQRGVGIEPNSPLDPVPRKQKQPTAQTAARARQTHVPMDRVQRPSKQVHPRK